MDLCSLPIEVLLNTFEYLGTQALYVAFLLTAVFSLFLTLSDLLFPTPAPQM